MGLPAETWLAPLSLNKLLGGACCSLAGDKVPGSRSKGFKGLRGYALVVGSLKFQRPGVAWLFWHLALSVLSLASGCSEYT